MADGRDQIHQNRQTYWNTQRREEGNQQDNMENTGEGKGELPDFTNSGRYSGDIPASRWLTRLSYDFKKAKHNPLEAELFLEAIEMLLEGEPAKRLDSTPPIREIIDNRETATTQDVNHVRDWLLEEFPTAVTDVAKTDVHVEIGQWRQGRDEPLAAYYQRTLGLVKRAKTRDKPRVCTREPPETAENIMLKGIVYAFLRGLNNRDLRRQAVKDQANAQGALWRAYEMVSHIQQSIALDEQMEEEDRRIQRVEELEDFILSQHGKPAAIMLANAAANAPRPQVTSRETHGSDPTATRPNFLLPAPVSLDPQNNHHGSLGQYNSYGSSRGGRGGYRGRGRGGSGYSQGNHGRGLGPTLEITHRLNPGRNQIPKGIIHTRTLETTLARRS